MERRLVLSLAVFVFCSYHLYAQQLQWSTGYTFGANNLNPAVIPWDSITHVSHFSLWVASNGTVSGAPVGLTTSASQALVAEAHARGKKALICVGGYGDGPAYQAATTTAAARAVLINNILNYMTTYGYDGVDIDWEDGVVQSQHVALARELRAKLDTISPRPLLTFAVQCWVHADDLGLSQYADQMNIMSYTVGVSTLYATELACFDSEGVPRSKLGIGIGLGDGGGVDTSVSAVKAKCDYAYKNGYAGVMQWLIEDDYNVNGATFPWMSAIEPYISVTAPRPVTANDAYSTYANTNLYQGAPGVLANDSDPGGASLTATLITVPIYGSVTLNSDGSFTYIPAINYTGNDRFDYAATNMAGSSSNATATISVLPSVLLSSLVVSPTTVSGGATSTGTVTLSSPAPGEGIVVALGDNSSAAAVPANVTILGGTSSATFNITTTQVSSNTSATISAVYGTVTKTASLTITAPPTLALTSVTVSPTSVRGRRSATGTVKLNAPAPSGGVLVTLSDNSIYASIPASVTIPSGSTSAAFTITTSSVFSTRYVTISAKYLGVTKTTVLTITR
jgi:chitinase